MLIWFMLARYVIPSRFHPAPGNHEGTITLSLDEKNCWIAIRGSCAPKAALCPLAGSQSKLGK